MKKIITLTLLLSANFYANAQFSGILNDLKTLSENIKQQQQKTPQAAQPVQVQQQESAAIQKTSTPLPVDSNTNQVEAVKTVVAMKPFVKEDIGYLNGKVKTFDGAGCSYIRREDDKKNSQSKLVGADDENYKGLVLNIGGNDILFKEVSRSEKLFVVKYNDITLSIPEGKVKSCGIECSKTLTNFEFQQGKTPKVVVPVVSFCGS